jgi:FolB domain-containing protein
MATDQIQIKDLLIRTIIGTLPEERVQKQDVIINIILLTDHTPAISDDLADAIDYRDIIGPTIELVEKSQFYLIERLAFEILGLCFTDSRVERAIVTVEKPRAVPYAASAGVTVDRSRAEFLTSVQN